MKVLVYSAKSFEIPFLKLAAKNTTIKLAFTKERLTEETIIKSKGFKAISIFSADKASSVILEKLSRLGVKYITLRSAGYDNINIKEAKSYGFTIANSPKYSPNAIAEHAIALLMALKRNLILANEKVKNYNFTLDNLIGSNLQKKTVAVLGTGKIGRVIIKILHGFNCNILVNDIETDEELIRDFNVTYVSKDDICKQANVIIISLPLTSETHYLINESFLQKIKKEDVIIVNIGRGGIVKTTALLEALNSGLIKGYATDVYEKESGMFFYNHTQEGIEDEVLKTLINHPKVLLTPHQAFATEEAITNITETTIYNLNCWLKGQKSSNELN